MINDLPTYDKAVFPKLIAPLNITQNISKKYLGNKHLKGTIIVKVGYIATDEQINAFYLFWKNKLLDGTKEFIIQLNVLDINSDNNHLLAVKMLKPLLVDKNGIISKGTIELEIIYMVNQLNELVEL